MPAANPIQRRQQQLQQQWRAFSDDEAARLLCWLIEPGDARMMDAFFEAESHEDGDNPDLFVRLDTPFLAPGEHGHQLLVALDSHYRALRDELIAEGLADASWHLPPRLPDDGGGVRRLAQAATSFRDHHQPLFRRLVLVLQPQQRIDPGAWTAWLARAAEACAGAPVRLVAFDDVRRPSVSQLAAEQPARVQVAVARLAMGKAMEEISEQAGQLDSPHGAYRHGFLQLGEALGRADMTGAEAIANRLAMLAEQQPWWHLVVAAHFALAAGWMAQSEPHRAWAAYQLAEQAAEQAVQRDEAYGAGLRIKVRVASGAVLLTLGAYPDAAAHYQHSAALAEAAEDPLMALECHRLSSYAHERAGDLVQAWRAALAALAAGHRLPEAMRAQSTLAFVGDALLRIAEARGRDDDHGAALAQMCTLLGEDWQTLLQPQHPPTLPQDASAAMPAVGVSGAAP